MEEILQSLYQIRELALQKEENEKNINQLRGQLQDKKNLNEMKDENHKTKLGMSRYIIIFVILDVLIGNLLDRIFYFIVVLTCGHGFTVSSAFQAAFFDSHYLIFPVRMVIGIPFALIITFVIRVVIKARDKKKARQNIFDNQKSAKENEQISQNNVNVDRNNRIITEQIVLYEQMQGKLLEELRNTAPWYPEIYFTIPIVNYIIQQLETGKAKSVNQAIVHYEAGQK